MGKVTELFFGLLRAALSGADFKSTLSDSEWQQLYWIADRQGLLGVCFQAISRLPSEQQAPVEVRLQWWDDAENIRRLNQEQYEEAVRLTRLFTDAGRKSAVLKGQANARLYPDPLSRQPGDIDIWVEGGRESVIALLLKLGLLDERPTQATVGIAGKATASYHHVHLPQTEQGVVVEVHFRPSSGNFYPLTNRRLQRWLEKEITDSTSFLECPPNTKAGEFGVPSMPFALVMQLAHVQHHLMSEGIGLRQVVDYGILLQSATDDDRRKVSALLGRFGLRHSAGALMWVLDKVLHLDRGLLLCEPDEYRGRWMLHEILEGGNFGFHAERQQQSLWRRFFAARRRRFNVLRFDFHEALWVELEYWKNFFWRIPIRIRLRTLSLRDIPR